MVERLNKWFNSGKDYFKGVVLYSHGEHDAALLLLFKNGPTPYNQQRLEKELQTKLQLLQTNASLKAQGNPIQIRNVVLKEAAPTYPLQKPAVITVDEVPENNELYNAAKAEADKEYKRVMNLRTELFILARQDDYTDPNSPDRVAQRRQLALDVVKGFNAASLLYEKADYIKSNGRIPDYELPEDDIDPMLLPDSQVKQALDNTRKNYNKMKKREQTPERILLQQKHEKTISILSERWALLKQ
jgi:hypothetical protein